jgi:RNA polymerase sigma-70 factor (ECF subfamily)
MLDDRWLLWRVKRGSARALRRLYGKYEADLLTLATSLLGRSDRAEDVLQDVFIRFIESLETFELTGSLKGYLATCVANRARDLRRRDRSRPAGPLDMAERVPSNQPGPLQGAIAHEQYERLTHALAQLPYEQQETVLLHLQTGLTFREIGQMQDVSPKTAESRYRYGIDKLRSMLNGEAEA